MATTPQLNSKDQVEFWGNIPNAYKADILGAKILDWSSEFMGERVLDLGAANGSLIREISRRNPSLKLVVGVDIAPRSPDVLQGDCTKLSFQDAEFDTLYFTDVIEHLSDQDLPKCLAEMNRVLSIGGHAVVNTLNNEDLRDLSLQCPHCHSNFHRWGHFQVFNEARVKQLFSQFGFEIVKLRVIHLGRWNRYGFLVPFLRALGVHRFFRKGTWDIDLLFVAKKVANL